MANIVPIDLFKNVVEIVFVLVTQQILHDFEKVFSGLLQITIPCSFSLVTETLDGLRCNLNNVVNNLLQLYHILLPHHHYELVQDYHIILLDIQ